MERLHELTVRLLARLLAPMPLAAVLVVVVVVMVDSARPAHRMPPITACSDIFQSIIGAVRQ